MLSSVLSGLSAANASCALAASVNFERTESGGAFQVRQATAEEVKELKGVEHPALSDGAKLKEVMTVLSGLVQGAEHKEELGAQEAEGDELMGEVAEMRAQLMEVKSSCYVKARVEEETHDARREREQEEEAMRAVRADVSSLKAKLKAVDANLEKLQAGKRKREAQDANSSEHDTLQALERDIEAQEIAIAEAEDAVAAEKGRVSRCRDKRQKEESEVRLVNKALAAKRAQAEASLQSTPEYQELVQAIEAARGRVALREEEQVKALQQLGELRGGLTRLTEGMSAKGHAAASALRVLLQANEGVPLSTLKEQLTSHLCSVGNSKGKETQQVLEAIYSLTSSSLIHIDRTSARQLVTPCV